MAKLLKCVDCGSMFEYNIQLRLPQHPCISAGPGELASGSTDPGVAAESSCVWCPPCGRLHALPLHLDKAPEDPTTPIGY